jgi:hypothetical protein
MGEVEFVQPAPHRLVTASRRLRRSPPVRFWLLIGYRHRFAVARHDAPGLCDDLIAHIATRSRLFFVYLLERHCAGLIDPVTG